MIYVIADRWRCIVEYEMELACDRSLAPLCGFIGLKPAVGRRDLPPTRCRWQSECAPLRDQLQSAADVTALLTDSKAHSTNLGRQWTDCAFDFFLKNGLRQHPRDC